MTASNKRKKEKQKDFQKAKLKVGKQKPKAENATDTSFKSRKLVLGNQGLSEVAPSANALFRHHASMLKNRSDTHRQESLAYLTTAVANWTQDEPLPEPPSTFLPKLQPLMLDPSGRVRQQLLKLLKVMPRRDVERHASQMLLYVRAAMTHLSADIKLYSIDVIEWLMGAACGEATSGKGGWTRILRLFITLIGWELSADGQSNGWHKEYKTTARPGDGSKLQSRQLAGLTAVIRAGLARVAVDGTSLINTDTFPLWDVAAHQLPERLDPFGHINIFGDSFQNDEDQMLEDREDRQRIFVEIFEQSIEAGTTDLMRQGGEMGRTCAFLKKVINEGLSDFDRGRLSDPPLVPPRIL